MRSFYMRIFKNIICIYVLALCCFAYATMIHAIPDHVYVQEGQKLELDKKIPVTLAMSTKPQSVMAQIGERTFQAMKQERAVETCSQLKQGEYTLTCYLFGILPMKEVQVSVVNGKSLYVSGQVVAFTGLPREYWCWDPARWKLWTEAAGSRQNTLYFRGIILLL